MLLRDNLLRKFDNKSFSSASFQQLLDFLESFQMEIYFRLKQAEVDPYVINALLQFFSSERKNIGTKLADKNNLVYQYVVTSALHHFVSITPSEELSSRLVLVFVALNFNHSDICDHYGKELQRVAELPKKEQNDFLYNLYYAMDATSKYAHSGNSKSLGDFLYEKVLFFGDDDFEVTN